MPIYIPLGVSENLHPVSCEYVPRIVSGSFKPAFEGRHRNCSFEILILVVNGAVHPELHQTPGNGRIRTGRYDSCHYFIEPISGQHKRITLNIWNGGGDDKTRYIYEVRVQRIYPQSYQLMAYPLCLFVEVPYGLGLTVVFLWVCKILCKQYAKRRAARQENMPA